MCLPHKPFKIEKEWRSTGNLLCVATQQRECGSRCGYVRVPPSHPLHGKDYDAVDIRAHGGLTFAAIEPCSHTDGQGWWFGIDFAHCFDMMFDPATKIEDMTDPEAIAFRKGWESMYGEGSIFSRYENLHGVHYWTLPEVIQEVEDMAEQLALVGMMAMVVQNRPGRKFRP